MGMTELPLAGQASVTIILRHSDPHLAISRAWCLNAG
jgi:hypothetical protein